MTGETSREVKGQEDAPGLLVTDIWRANLRHAMYQVLRLLQSSVRDIFETRFVDIEC